MENNDIGNISRTVENAAARLGSAIDRAAGAVHPAVDQASTAVHNTLDKVAGAAGSAAQTLEARGRQLLDAPLQAADRCRAQVAEKPLTMLAIAAATGFVLNWLLRKRPSTRNAE